MSTAVAPKRPAEEWTPPVDADGLRLVLERFRVWQPLDIEDVLTISTRRSAISLRPVRRLPPWSTVCATT
ncbi:hypothetical protein [Streptomyces griseoluteus]|uniref:hypothetical protein n=1 Tax=Streptomyces griseoluteus TaxID=29306 RepID=UPI001FCAFA2A|nr:hypothetical protein [Streptomyces griseoluteus]